MSAIEKLIDNMYEDFFHMDHLYSEFAKRFGESYYSMAVLFLLGENPEGISQKNLASELFLPKQTVSSIIGSFEKRGYVAHRKDEADGRSKLHVLTGEGALHYRTIADTLRAIELRCAEQVGEDNMALVHTISTRYLDLFEHEVARSR